jgi:hypothetical protein
VISVPPGRCSSVSVTSAVSSGRSFASSTIRSGASSSRTTVMSSMCSGPAPCWCAKRLPGCGHSGSIVRVFFAPTTHPAYRSGVLSTANTSSWLKGTNRRLVATLPECPQAGTPKLRRFGDRLDR